MQEPIEAALKNEKQVALARLQDSIVESIVEVDPSIVFHGGTAIWRCYNGNRFSEDVDIYATPQQMKKLSWDMDRCLSKRNAHMKYSISEGAAGVTSPDAKARFESMRAPKGLKRVEREYFRADGSKMFVYTLPISAFIEEKIRAYESRAYVRDLYDIYHLVSLGELEIHTAMKLRQFVAGIKRPADEKKLKDLIYSGVAPSFETMVEAIKTAIR